MSMEIFSLENTQKNDFVREKEETEYMNNDSDDPLSFITMNDEAKKQDNERDMKDLKSMFENLIELNIREKYLLPNIPQCKNEMMKMKSEEIQSKKRKIVESMNAIFDENEVPKEYVFGGSQKPKNTKEETWDQLQEFMHKITKIEDYIKCTIFVIFIPKSIGKDKLEECGIPEDVQTFLPFKFRHERIKNLEKIKIKEKSICGDVTQFINKLLIFKKRFCEKISSIKFDIAYDPEDFNISNIKSFSDASTRELDNEISCGGDDDGNNKVLFPLLGKVREPNTKEKSNTYPHSPQTQNNQHSTNGTFNSSLSQLKCICKKIDCYIDYLVIINSFLVSFVEYTKKLCEKMRDIDIHSNDLSNLIAKIALKGKHHDKNKGVDGKFNKEELEKLCKISSREILYFLRLHESSFMGIFIDKIEQMKRKLEKKEDYSFCNYDEYDFLRDKIINEYKTITSICSLLPTFSEDVIILKSKHTNKNSNMTSGFSEVIECLTLIESNYDTKKVLSKQNKSLLKNIDKFMGISRRKKTNIGHPLGHGNEILFNNITAGVVNNTKNHPTMNSWNSKEYLSNHNFEPIPEGLKITTKYFPEEQIFFNDILNSCCDEEIDYLLRTTTTSQERKLFSFFNHDHILNTIPKYIEGCSVRNLNYFGCLEILMDKYGRYFDDINTSSLALSLSKRKNHISSSHLEEFHYFKSYVNYLKNKETKTDNVNSSFLFEENTPIDNMKESSTKRGDIPKHSHVNTGRGNGEENPLGNECDGKRRDHRIHSLIHANRVRGGNLSIQDRKAMFKKCDRNQRLSYIFHLLETLKLKNPKKIHMLVNQPEILFEKPKRGRPPNQENLEYITIKQIQSLREFLSEKDLLDTLNQVVREDENTSTMATISSNVASESVMNDTFTGQKINNQKYIVDRKSQKYHKIFIKTLEEKWIQDNAPKFNLFKPFYRWSKKRSSNHHDTKKKKKEKSSLFSPDGRKTSNRGRKRSKDFTSSFTDYSKRKQMSNFDDSLTNQNLPVPKKKRLTKSIDTHDEDMNMIQDTNNEKQMNTNNSYSYSSSHSLDSLSTSDLINDENDIKKRGHSIQNSIYISQCLKHKDITFFDKRNVIDEEFCIP